MVGMEIKKYLFEHGIKQNYLADKLNIPAWKLHGRLTGEIELKATELYQICEILGEPLERFLNAETIKDEKITED